jgi:hypothetical protein
VRFPLCRPEALRALFASAGLKDVATSAIDIATPFASFDDYWSPFLGGNGPAPAYAMSLDEPARARLRERIRERLPICADGSLRLTARAWAVRGTVSKWETRPDIAHMEAPATIRCTRSHPSPSRGIR